MGEAVSCCCKDVGDAGVDVGIVAGVRAELSTNHVVTQNVWQIVPEHKQLRQTEKLIWIKRQWSV